MHVEGDQWPKITAEGGALRAGGEGCTREGWAEAGRRLSAQALLQISCKRVWVEVAASGPSCRTLQARGR